jgi:hypothetical protein
MLLEGGKVLLDLLAVLGLCGCGTSYATVSNAECRGPASDAAWARPGGLFHAATAATR